MKKRAWAFLLAAVITCSVTGCGKTPSSSSSGEQQPAGAAATYDKSKLIWNLTSSPPSQEVQKELNRLLQERGYTVQVEFTTDSTTPTDLKNSGKQVDLMTFQPGAEGLFQDLTPYFQTELGKKTEQAFDAKLWKLISDGDKRYYVPKGTLNGESRAYTVNKTIMEKYDLTQSDLSKPLDELEPIFERVKQGEGELFIPCAFNISTPVNDPTYVEFVAILKQVLVLKKEGNGNQIENVYQNQDCIRRLKAIKQFRDKGYLGADDLALSHKTVDQGKFLLVNSIATFPENDALQSTFNLNSDEADSVTVPISKISYTDAYLIDEGRNMCNGVTNWSQNPDIAFEILALTVTDPQISNLLIHGIENANYTVEDGMAVPKDDYTNFVGIGMTFQPLGNDLLTYPLKGQQLKDKQQAFASFNRDIKGYQSAGFRPDFTKVQEEYDRLVQFQKDKMSNNKSIWYGYSDDVEADLRRINDELNEAGIDKVLQELNKQLEQFYQSQ